MRIFWFFNAFTEIFFKKNRAYKHHYSNFLALLKNSSIKFHFQILRKQPLEMFYKKAAPKNVQYWQENTCVGVSFW